jgi:glycine/D-amino acid oxidase-like deaminating enzyme/nitrite reductase/ring-hydroxylating ferredoxin subunit
VEYSRHRLRFYEAILFPLISQENAREGVKNMNTSITKEMSIWATEDIPPNPALDNDTTTDVCIVGAGIAGMNIAYLLGRAGKNVLVIDDGPIAGGQTGMTTAHLSNEIDDRYSNIERLHGEEGARLIAESHTEAINKYEAIIHKERINCDFKRLDGYLFSARQDQKDLLQREYEAAKRTRFVGVEWLQRAPLTDFNTGPCLRFLNQGQFHPLKYLSGLAQAIQRDGGRIYSETHAERIEGGKPALVQTRRGPIIRCQDIVIATNSPVNDLIAIHTKQAAYHTYVIGGVVPAGSVHEALYWDTEDPYHYVRLQRSPQNYSGGIENSLQQILIVGGEDHKSGQADDGEMRYHRLEQWARERFPVMGEVLFHWSGQVMEPMDGVAFIGRNPLDDSNVFITTGDSGMGMTHGMIAGMLITDLILGKTNAWEEIYNPQRKTLRALGEFAKENFNVALQYADWITPGDVDSSDRLQPGEGAVIRHGLRKIAYYRRKDGTLIALSAICPHLKCIVAWNSSDSTWDCPCHGSRFTAEGTVINGPANVDLSRMDVS